MSLSVEAVKLIYEWQSDPNNEFYIKPDEFETETLKSFNGPLKKYEGILLMNDVVNISRLKDLKIRPEDSFVIGFPKSGTTWIEEMVWQIQNELNFENAEEMYHFARIPWIDRGYSALVMEELPSPRTFKSHSPPKFYQPGFTKIGKVVYVVRNPKDVLISTFKFLKSMTGNEYIGTLDEMVDLFVEGKTLFGPWWEHLNEYEKLENVHFIHYEDLIEKPMETTRALVKYLGADLSDDDIKKLLAFVSFDNMKKTPSMDMKAMSHMFKEDLNFFNSGQIGTWKKYLNEEQSKKIDDMVKKNLTYKKPIQYEPTKKE